MGKLIKNHWARLIVLVAAHYHLWASFFAFFFPKFFFDFWTKNFDKAVKPFPILQIINICLALVSLAVEWPAGFVAGTSIQRSLGFRLFWLPLCIMSCVIMYQTTNAALYYLIGTAGYFWAYADGEVICAGPWTLPRRRTEKMLQA